jgi:hypothetical protein
MGNIRIYRKYPFDTNWVDISSIWRTDKIDIEERVNSPGIATLTVSNPLGSIGRSIFAGQMYKIWLETPDEHWNPKPDFEGYIPNNYMQNTTGVSSNMDISITGYLQKWADYRNRCDIRNFWVPSAIGVLNSQIYHPVQLNYMDYAGQFLESINVKSDIKQEGDCLSIMKDIRESLFDYLDMTNPRFYHLVTSYRYNQKPIIRLMREPSLTDTPQIILDPNMILQKDDEDTSDLLTSIILGDTAKWSIRFTNKIREKQMGIWETDAQSKEYSGLESSRKKSISLLRGRLVGKSTRLTISRNTQIPLLALVGIDDPIHDLNGNYIVYGKRICRDKSITTELLLRNLPDEML